MIEIPSASQRWNRLVLVGFMGAGKSTVGALLASHLHLPFVDSDTEIEQHTARTIGQLFEERGEAQFRLLEAQIIADLLTRKQVVIALGGGALESAATFSLLREADDTFVIHLEAPLSTLLERCGKETFERSGEAMPVRPLLRDQQALIARYDRRLEDYRLADITVVTEGLTAEIVLEHVLRVLEHFSCAGRASRYMCGPFSTEGNA